MATKKKAETAVAEVKDNTPTAMPDFMDSGDVGGGMEGADKETFATPFLRIIQKTSPQVDEGAAEFIEEAKAGMFINSVSGEVYDGRDEGLIFLPCAYQRRFIRWAARNEGGGFKGELTAAAVAQLEHGGEAKVVEGRLLAVDENGEFTEKKSDVLSDTRSHFGLMMTPDGGVHQCLMPLTSTQIKKSKKLMSELNAIRVQGPNGLVAPPTWMNMVRLKTLPESNEHGSWYGIKMTMEGLIQDADLYAAGKAFSDAINEGQVGAVFDDEKPSGKTEEEGKKF